MKTLVSLLASTLATTALTATDFERFDKLVSKYAVNLAGQDNPKGLCLCLEEGELMGSFGFLLLGSSAPIGGTSFVTSNLGCFVPGFDENTGERGSTFVCMNFVPLVK
jgi:hypothetical protein